MATIHQLRTKQPVDFFSRADFELFRAEFASDTEHDDVRLSVKEKLIALHDELAPRLRELGWDLFPASKRQSLVSPARVSAANPSIERLRLRYAKPELLRQLMRKKFGAAFDDLDAHAQLAVTLNHEGLGTELVMSHTAWVDAENFRNKVVGGSPRKHHLRQLFANLNDFVMTFEIQDESVYKAQATRLVNLGMLNLAFAKFQPRVHTLRVRALIRPNDENLARGVLSSYVTDRFAQLYPLYDYLAWSPKNKYVST